MEKFDFKEAFMHFQRTEGPSGFIWKYLLAYLVIMGAATALYFWAFISAYWPFIQSIDQYGNPTLSESEAIDMSLRVGLVALISVPIMLMISSVFEASALRRYMRKSGFSLGFGADELRVIVVYLIWAGLVFLLYIAIFAVMAVLFGGFALAGGEEAMIMAVVLMIPLMIGIFILFIFFMIRWAPASAISIRDRKITFFKAWNATKGRFWNMLGAYFLIYLVVYGIQMALQLIAIAFFGAALMTNIDALESEDPEQIMQVFLNPIMIIPLLVMLVGYVLSMGFMHFAFLGVASKAARTDPTWRGDLSTADTF